MKWNEFLKGKLQEITQEAISKLNILLKKWNTKFKKFQQRIIQDRRNTLLNSIKHMREKYQIYIISFQKQNRKEKLSNSFYKPSVSLTPKLDKDITRVKLQNNIPPEYGHKSSTDFINSRSIEEELYTMSKRGVSQECLILNT